MSRNIFRRLPARLRTVVFAALFAPLGVATAQVLYVAGSSDKVAAYDATTGQPLAGFVPIKGGSYAVALGGNTLYAANKTGVGTYDATTGVPINARFISELEDPRFITDLAIHGNTLFVATSTGVKVSSLWTRQQASPLMASSSKGFSTRPDSSYWSRIYLLSMRKMPI